MVMLLLIAENLLLGGLSFRSWIVLDLLGASFCLRRFCVFLEVNYEKNASFSDPLLEGDRDSVLGCVGFYGLRSAAS